MSYVPSAGSVNLSAGTTSNNLSNAVFSNSNGVSFGLNGSTITASVAPGGGGLTNINISGGTTSNNLSNVVFNNSNGVSFGLNGSTVTATVQTNYLTTAMLSNAATISNIRVSAGTTSNLLSDITFSNSNGISFGLNGSTITAQHNALTTARASNDAIGLNTAQTNVTWTVNSAGLSLNAGGYAGTGTALNLTNLTGTLSANSNGVSLSMSAAAPGGGAGATLSRFHTPEFGATTIGAPINASASIVYVPMYQNVSGTRFDIMGSVSVATAANTSSAGLLYTLSVVFHTKNGLTLNSVSSATAAATHNWQSNSTASMSGVRLFTVPININATPGNYYVAVQLSTRANGHSGAATTSLGNTISLYGVATAINGAYTINSFGVATNSSTGWFIQGMNSSTGNITQISLSNLTVVGTQQNRANIALRIEA